jgi:arabinose operon protein AraL
MSGTPSLDKVKTCIIDLDGVLWRRNAVIDGASTSVNALRENGLRTLFLTNSSALSRNQVVAKLNKFDIDASADDVLVSSRATAEYIAGVSASARVFVLGSDGLAEEMTASGLEVISAPADAEFLAVGYDSSLNDERLGMALKALLAGARFIATNDDGMLPSEDGYRPGAGAVVGAVKGMIRREPDVIIGKPSHLILGDLLARTGMIGDECLVIGDSVGSDIQFARRMGAPSVLVLTGNTRSRAEAEQAVPRPDFIRDSISDIPALLGLKERPRQE